MYEMIYEWRAVMDEYQNTHGGDTRIMMTEAYANETFTMKFYQSADGRQGSHMPFNFVLINDLHAGSSAADFKRVIDGRINALPTGKMTNWVIGNINSNTLVHSKILKLSNSGEAFKKITQFQT